MKKRQRLTLIIITVMAVVACHVIFGGKTEAGDAKLADNASCGDQVQCANNCASGYGVSAGANFVCGPTSVQTGGFGYRLLESFPGFYSQGETMTDFPALILAIYKFGIWTVGIAGLFMLIIGGFMYMGSAGNNATVTTAKRIITDALFGVVAAMGAYLFMYVINPDLTKIDIAFTKVEITEPEDTSPESSGDIGGVEAGVPGTCAGLSTQTGIAAQCSSASQQLSRMLDCMKERVPNAVITSITDSGGYARCTGPAWTDANCAHGHYSCHYGGKSCFSNGKSYAVDLSTRNGMSASTLISAAVACGATYTKDESGSANHVHASVGKAAACGCN